LAKFDSLWDGQCQIFDGLHPEFDGHGLWHPAFFLLKHGQSEVSVDSKSCWPTISGALGALDHFFKIFPFSSFIIPTDELHHFSEG
jgi:hypothetical protein